MITYNVTCSMDISISDEWLRWMEEVHVPDVMRCGIFISVNIHKVLQEFDNQASYAIQYSCNDMKDLLRYEVSFAPSLRKRHFERYKDKVICFRTILERVSAYKDSL